MEAAIKQAIGATLGTPVVQARALSGGDINDAYAVTLDDGRAVFVKANQRVIPGMFAAEARGLAWLGQAQAARVPQVIAFDDRFLILELIRPAPPVPTFDEELGVALAALHRASAPTFGLDHDNFIGRLPQSNRPTTRWGAFYARERLEPQLRQAVDAGLLSAAARRGLAQVVSRIDDLVGADEPPARLHGDLWGGNLMRDERGRPCLIDPSAYGGHREVDLAMMRLFGGFGERTFAAYHEAFPLAPGHGRRVGLYQLYPLLVHVNLFGGSYAFSVESVVDSLLAAAGT